MLRASQEISQQARWPSKSPSGPCQWLVRSAVFRRQMGVYHGALAKRPSMEQLSFLKNISTHRVGQETRADALGGAMAARGSVRPPQTLGGTQGGNNRTQAEG